MEQRRRIGTPPRPRGRSADVYVQLRADIVNGRLTPATRLRFEQLRDTYGAGLSPLRESLMRLLEEGLVEFEEMKGFRVKPISLDELRDITFLRIELEGMALRLSIKNGGPSWEAGIVGACHQLVKHRKLGPDGQIDASWEEVHRQFHRALRAACGSPWLERFCETLYDQSDRYRKVHVHYITSPRDDVAEHEAIAKAAINRDTETAERALRSHFMETMRILADVVE